MGCCEVFTLMSDAARKSIWEKKNKKKKHWFAIKLCLLNCSRAAVVFEDYYLDVESVNTLRLGCRCTSLPFTQCTVTDLCRPKHLFMSYILLAAVFHAVCFKYL